MTANSSAQPTPGTSRMVAALRLPEADGRTAWGAYDADTGGLSEIIGFAELTPDTRDLFKRIETACQAPARTLINTLRTELEEMRASLATLTDRAEAGGVITEDEAGEYRELTSTHTPVPRGDG